MTAELMIALVTLTLLEIVLGIDNVIFIAILAGRLPKEQQDKARKLGLLAALVTRLLLLGMLFFLSQMDKAVLFQWTWLGVPETWVTEEARDVTVKDLVLLVGGLFLIFKSTMEIHHKLEGEEDHAAGGGTASFGHTIVMISIMDLVFSLDSVITAVGMVKADPSKGIDYAAIGVMVTAMMIALGVMLVFAGMISEFVARHPTIKILALAFLILIGVMLVVEGTGGHINKGYIYFAMAFSVAVEMLNLRLRGKRDPVRLREPQMPHEATGL